MGPAPSIPEHLVSSVIKNIRKPFSALITINFFPKEILGTPANHLYNRRGLTCNPDQTMISTDEEGTKYTDGDRERDVDAGHTLAAAYFDEKVSGPIFYPDKMETLNRPLLVHQTTIFSLQEAIMWGVNYNFFDGHIMAGINSYYAGYYDKYDGAMQLRKRSLDYNTNNKVTQQYSECRGTDNIKTYMPNTGWWPPVGIFHGDIDQGSTNGDLLSSWKSLFGCTDNKDLTQLVENAKNVCGPNPKLHTGTGYVEAHIGSCDANTEGCAKVGSDYEPRSGYKVSNDHVLASNGAIASDSGCVSRTGMWVDCSKRWRSPRECAGGYASKDLRNEEQQYGWGHVWGLAPDNDGDPDYRNEPCCVSWPYESYESNQIKDGDGLCAVEDGITDETVYTTEEECVAAGTCTANGGDSCKGLEDACEGQSEETCESLQVAGTIPLKAVIVYGVISLMPRLKKIVMPTLVHVMTVI